MKYWTLLVVSVAFMIQAAQAANCRGDLTRGYPCEQDPYGGGGGDVPIPFGLNSRAELADGENYILYGSVLIAPKSRGSKTEVAYFVVDLDAHPWLANKRRKAEPLYPLLGRVSDWREFDGQKVRLGCAARGGFGRNENQQLIHVISLEARQIQHR